MLHLLYFPNRCHNLNVTEVRDSDFKNAFDGIFNFTVGILARIFTQKLNPKKTLNLLYQLKEKSKKIGSGPAFHSLTTNLNAMREIPDHLMEACIFRQGHVQGCSRVYFFVFPDVWISRTKSPLIIDRLTVFDSQSRSI